MDLLGSILNSMTAPPSLGEKQKKILKEQKVQQEKQQAEEKFRLSKFRTKIEEAIDKFVKDPTHVKFRFEPMDKMHRTIVHDVAEVAGLIAHSFGEEEVDRAVMVFKRDYAPSEEELAAYRRGEDWDPEKAKQHALEKEQAKLLASMEEHQKQKFGKHHTFNSDYKEKYEKLIGKEVGKDAARITTPNKQFGYVPSDNKRDLRSIEQTLADIRAKKRQRTEEDLGTESTAD